MITLEEPVCLDNKKIKSNGQDWEILDISVLSKNDSKVTGKITVRNGKFERQESHTWTAQKQNDLWTVYGEGAILANGDRLRSANSYPFSLDQKVNEGMRDFIRTWVSENYNKIRRTREVFIPAVVTPEISTPKPVPQIAKAKTAPVTPHPTQTTPETKEPPKTGPKPHGLEFLEVLVSEIVPFKGQPREEFTESDLREMSESLGQEGQKELITVTPTSEVPGKRWELVNGERRYRGALASGTEKLWAVVRRYKSKADQFWDSFTMNWNRQGHTHLESSNAIARALSSGKTIEEVCKATGRSRVWVYQQLQIGNLHPSLKELLRVSVPKKQRIASGVARDLALVLDQEKQVEIWQEASKEKSRGLIALKVKELVGANMTGITRRRKKSGEKDDRVKKLVRIFHTAETDTFVVNAVTDTSEFEALKRALIAKGYDLATVAQKMRAIAESWQMFAQKIS